MAADVTTDQLLGWYRSMYQIRRLEELAAKAYSQKKILGFCHLYIGQEAVAVGANAALRPSDVMVTAYRDHGQVLARGASPRAVMAELFGKETGMVRGVGGSMHMIDRDLNFFGGYGIVGAHPPLGAGAAFAAQYLGTEGVSLTFLGDGATNQGAFFEALALSALWKLPAVYVIENNGYGMGTAVSRASHLTELHKRADGVGMKNWRFDGHDVTEVYENMQEAVDHARSGKGPVLLEVMTYRFRGHSMSDPAKYRPEGELDSEKERDCLKIVEQRLYDQGITEDAIKELRKEVQAECQDAYDFADSSAEPDPSKIYDYTYAE